MSNYVISCCTTVDITKEHLESLNVEYIYFHFFLDNKHYDDDLGQSISYKEFYEAMRRGADTKTSQVNATEYEEFFEKFLKEGKDVLHINLSSGISGAHNSANIAKNMLEERYPDRKIYVVDSLTAASGYGMMVDHAAHMREDGCTIDQVYEWLLANRLRLQAWVITTDLTYLVRGGRVSKAAGVVGGALGICPLITVDGEGKLSVRQKVRPKKKALKVLVEQMELNGYEGGNCFLCHSDCEEDAVQVVSLIEDKYPQLKGKVLVNSIGTTIGSHTGPGTIAIFFWGNEK